VLPVLLVEDLHWADDSSLDLLQHLMAHAAGPAAGADDERPARAAAAPPRLGHAAGTHAAQPRWPRRSSDAGAGAAAAPDCGAAETDRTHRRPRRGQPVLHGRAGAPAHRRRRHRHWRTALDGADGPAGHLQLPGTLVGLLQARLDALPAGERQAARQASVIGHVFWDDALQALDAQAPQALPALQRAAIVRDHDRSDFEGTPERQFDHHLLHQVTYDTLLKAERRWATARRRAGWPSAPRAAAQSSWP
jgi:hypothetical protein